MAQSATTRKANQRQKYKDAKLVNFRVDVWVTEENRAILKVQFAKLLAETLRPT